MKDEYDVIVVGSGPAGSTTAERCAANGLDVLILERNEKVGEPVRCAEGMSASSVEQLKLDIPEDCISEYIDGAVVYAPDGREIKIQFEATKGYILDRKRFDKWLAERAVKAGAELVLNANVIDLVKDGGIKGVVVELLGTKERKTIKSKVVVAADGAESVVARKAGLRTEKKPKFVDSGFQYKMRGIELEHPRMIVLYLGRKIAPRGYIWIFPKGKDSANVGIGITGEGCEKTAKQYLDEWIETKPGIKKGEIVEINGGCIPVGDFMENMTTDGLLCVGDAANQVNPLHGGGIAESIKAGRIAGDVISDSINGSSDLSEYNKRWWEQCGKRLKKTEKVREIFEKLTDDEMCDLADILSAEDLTDFVHGKNVLKLAKIYAKFKIKGMKRKIGFS